MTLTIRDLVSNDLDVQQELLNLNTKAEGQVVAAAASVAEALDYYDAAEWYTLVDSF